MLLRRLGILLAVFFAVLSGAQDQTSTPPDEYLLHPGDMLHITVAGEPDLPRWLCVSKDGFVGIPLVGSIPAAGKTIKQLQMYIEEKLGKFVEKPTVHVNMNDETGPSVRPRKRLSPSECPAPFPLPEPSFKG
jgi:protein involved in polysaccharide export with SLBB domain